MWSYHAKRMVHAAVCCGWKPTVARPTGREQERALRHTSSVDKCLPPLCYILMFQLCALLPRWKRRQFCRMCFLWVVRFVLLQNSGHDNHRKKGDSSLVSYNSVAFNALPIACQMGHCFSGAAIFMHLHFISSSPPSLSMSHMIRRRLTSIKE